jgi:5-(carboxyamino)imidazole ribonucleotide mutase
MRSKGKPAAATPKKTAAAKPRAGNAGERNPSRRKVAQRKPVVGIIMGSKSDWPTMEEAAKLLDGFGIAYEAEVVSAHRTPDKMMKYAENAQQRGLKLIIAGAGGAAHLPGMVAAKTRLPVLGVPVKSRALDGLDSLLSIAQMPAGIPVATFAVGVAGAKNAALFAAAILSLEDESLAARLERFRKTQTRTVLKNPNPRI